MTELRAGATRSVSASPERLLEFLGDYNQRQSILTERFHDYRVEEGGVGTGTVIAYTLQSPGRSREFRLRAEDSADGLVERDLESSFVCTWTVLPTATGSSVILEATWEGASGIGGFFERLFAPVSLRRTYGQVLDKLAAQVET
jgi:Polyketide cyclase / dehydrase and lipid transport